MVYWVYPQEKQSKSFNCRRQAKYTLGLKWCTTEAGLHLCMVSLQSLFKYKKARHSHWELKNNANLCALLPKTYNMLVQSLTLEANEGLRSDFISPSVLKMSHFFVQSLVNSKIVKLRSHHQTDHSHWKLSHDQIWPSLKQLLTTAL